MVSQVTLFLKWIVAKMATPFHNGELDNCCINKMNTNFDPQRTAEPWAILEQGFKE